MSDSKYIVSSSLSKSWKVFKEDWILYYAAQILGSIPGFVYSIYSRGGMYSSMEMTGPNSTNLLAYLVFLVVNLIFSAGLINVFLFMIRGKKITWKSFVLSFKTYVNFLIAQVIYLLVILGGLLLLILPGIYFSYKYMFVSLLVIDKKMGPIEAFKASAKMTKGIKWDLLAFQIAVAIFVIAGFFLLIVGLLITIPVGSLATLVLYDKVLERLE